MSTDGRAQRRERNRAAVVDAVLGLIHQGQFEPSPEDVASRAGVSARSVFRYFDDLDDLRRAAIARQLQLLEPLMVVDVSPDAPFGERLRAVVASRLALFEAVGEVGVMVRMRASTDPLVAGVLAEMRARLRGQLETLLAPEFDRQGSLREARAAAADVLCSFESYRLMRDRGLNGAEMYDALVDALGALVGEGVRA